MTPPTQALVLFAHGSRDPRWRQTFERLQAQLMDQLPHHKLLLAYMEMAEPTLDHVVRAAQADGITAFVVLPMFMASGGHLAHDVPNQIEALRQDGIAIRMLPPIGEHPQFSAWVAGVVQDAFALPV